MIAVTIYTDGACINNPGPGGYGIVLLSTIKGTEYRKELSQGFVRSTNNRMELMAVAVALESLKHKCKVNLYSDSQYVVNGINDGWTENWRKNGWSKKRGKVIRPKNIDLWKRILNSIDTHEVNCHWVKGHSGVMENERCDYLALNAASSETLIEDKEEPIEIQHDMF